MKRCLPQRRVSSLLGRYSTLLVASRCFSLPSEYFGPKMSAEDEQLTASTTIALRDGHAMPIVGLGTYLSSPEEAAAAVAEALRIGYRHIDTAEFYNNHEGIAAGIQAAGVPREQLFLVDKVTPGGLFGAPPRTPEEILELVPRQLQRLGTDYVDLYLLHHAFPREHRVAQYRALLALQTRGLVRSVGVSNWSEAHLEELRVAGLPAPAVNQIELHPLSAQEALRAYCGAQGIAVVAYSSLAPLASWRARPGQGSSKPAFAVEGAAASDEVDEQLQAAAETVERIAARRNRSAAQVLLRWALQRRVGVIPKSVRADRLAQNFALFDFHLSEDELRALDALDASRPFAWQIGDPLRFP